MAEKPPTPPINYEDTRNDPVLAEHVARAEEPHFNAMRAFKEQIMAWPTNELRKHSLARYWMEQAGQHLVNASMQAREDYAFEQNFDQDKLKHWLSEGYAMTVVGGAESEQASAWLSHGVAERVTAEFVPDKVRTEVGQRIDSDGKPKPVVIPKPALFKTIKPNSPKGHQRQVLIQYETITASQPGAPKYDYAGNIMSGENLKLKLVLPESDAKDFLALVNENPKAMRMLLDLQMQRRNNLGKDKDGKDKDWNDVRPPYSQWQLVNGGVSRMWLNKNVRDFRLGYQPTASKANDGRGRVVTFKENILSEADPEMEPHTTADDGGSTHDHGHRSHHEAREDEGALGSMNPYEILKLDKSATDADIKKKFRQLTREHHPDLGGDEEYFKKLSAAYDILSRPEMREYFDLYGSMHGYH